jgi:CHAT domain-containing protein
VEGGRSFDGSTHERLLQKPKDNDESRGPRQAQLEMIRGNGESDLPARRGVGGIAKLGDTPAVTTPSNDVISTSHPYFWAPFMLVGDGK